MENWLFFNSVFNDTVIESLKEEEKLLASLIYDNAREVIENDFNKISDEEGSDCEDFAEKFELTRSNLLKIIDTFNRAQRAKRKFQKLFPNWSQYRESNVSVLREIADCINKDRLNCNIAKVTGSAVGIIGGAALGVSLVFPPAALVLAIGGGITSFAGGATVFGTSVTEMALLKNKMDEAKEIFKKDQEEFQSIAEWFKHSQELIDLLDQVIGFSVIQEISEGLQKFKDDIKSFMSLKEGTIHSILKEIIRIFIQKAVSADFAPAYSELVLQIPVVIAFVFVVILFRKNNSLLFDCVVMTHRTVFGLIKLLDLGSDVGLLICNAAMKTGVAATEVVTKATAKIVTQGVLAGIGVVLDVTNIVFASIDIHKGSVSENAVQLKAISDQLENELRVLEAVKNALN